MSASTCRILLADAEQLIGEMSAIASGLRGLATTGEKREKMDAAAHHADAIVRRLTEAVYEAQRPRMADPGLPELPMPIGGELWRHFKGDTVPVICLARHSETKELLVVYNHGENWARPYAMWHEAEPKMGGRRRFEFITTEDT